MMCITYTVVKNNALQYFSMFRDAEMLDYRGATESISFKDRE